MVTSHPSHTHTRQKCCSIDIYHIIVGYFFGGAIFREKLEWSIEIISVFNFVAKSRRSGNETHGNRIVTVRGYLGLLISGK